MDGLLLSAAGFARHFCGRGRDCKAQQRHARLHQTQKWTFHTSTDCVSLVRFVLYLDFCLVFCGVLQLCGTIYLPECFVANTRELPQWKSCLIKICLRGCSLAQGVGVLRSLLPASLCRAHVDGPSFPPTDAVDHTLRVKPVLSCPTWPCNHRMCVIAKETGLSPLARTCSRTWVFLRRHHI